MGVNARHAVGYEKKVFATVETAFGTFVKPAATGAMKVLSFGASHSQDRHNRADSRATRSVLERITGRKTTSWTLEKYMIPSGTGSTSPDDDILLASVFGKSTAVSSTVEYTLTNDQSGFDIEGTVSPSFSLVREASRTVMESLAGCYVESLTISGAGADEPKFAYEGVAKTHIHTGSTGVVSSVSTDEVTLNSGQGKDYEAGSVVYFTTSDGSTVRDNNSSAGFKVSSISGDVLTVESNPTGLQAGDLCLPFVPSETTAGSPVNGISGSVSITSPATSLILTGFEVTIKNNYKPFGDEAFQSEITDYITNFREVSGSLTVRARRDQLVELGVRKNFTARDVAVTFGSGSGTTFVLDMDQIEIGFGDLSIPEAEEGTFTLPFVALGSSGEDEIQLTHQ